MGKHYVTFGQIHTHSINGKTLDKDCVAVIQAENYNEGRKKAIEYFGAKFGTSYQDDQFDQNDMQYYPRGFIYLN